MITISTRGRYSLRILVHMASSPAGHNFTKNEIADAEGVSSAYVQQLMIPLKAGGFVNSHRGKVGGFTFARIAETVTVADILKATEGDTALAPCLGNESCEREPSCATREVWAGAVELLDRYFGGITIADLVERGASGTSASPEVSIAE